MVLHHMVSFTVLHHSLPPMDGVALPASIGGSVSLAACQQGQDRMAGGADRCGRGHGLSLGHDDAL